jgi:hypothetical protein
VVDHPRITIIKEEEEDLIWPDSPFKASGGYE